MISRRTVTLVPLEKNVMTQHTRTRLGTSLFVALVIGFGLLNSLSAHVQSLWASLKLGWVPDSMKIRLPLLGIVLILWPLSRGYEILCAVVRDKAVQQSSSDKRHG